MPSPNGYTAHGMGESGRGEEAASDEKGRQGAHVSEMQRRRLLSAIVEVLGEHGLEGTTVGRICKRAGVSRRTFYDLYDDREECFLAAFDLTIGQLTEKILSGEQRAGKPLGGQRARAWRERVRSALTVLLESCDTERGLARLCLIETLKGGPQVLARRREITDTLVAIIDTGRLQTKSADPQPLTAEGLVGGAVAVIHARLIERDTRSFLELTNPLMSMIVLPYLGPAAARREINQPLPVKPAAAERSNGRLSPPAADPFRDLPIRITFRTVRVIAAVGSRPDASNREIAQNAGITDQGQMSKLLARLEKAGLIQNHGEGQARGEANAWRLTTHGQGVLHAVGGNDI